MASSVASFCDWYIVYKYFAEEESQGALQEAMDIVDNIRGICEIGIIRIEHEDLYYLVIFGKDISEEIRKTFEEMEGKERRSSLPEKLLLKAGMQLSLLKIDIGEISSDPVYQRFRLIPGI